MDKEESSPQRLRPGNVLRSLSLNAERYKRLKKKAVDEERSVSDIVDALIAGYLKGKYKLEDGG